MKYYSETLQKLFENPEELIDAETKHQEAVEAEEERKKAVASKKAARKKELANKVEDAEKAVDAAYETLDLAKQQCDEITKEANKAISEILSEAQKNLKDAQRARVVALTEFNNEFGPYKTAYTGDKATREINRVQRIVDDVFKNLILF